MPPITPTKPLIAPGGVSTYTPKPATTDIKTYVFPKEIIAVVGESGQGKTYSLRNVDWSTTALIDTELKGFPFDVSKIQHYYPCPDHLAVETALASIKANPGTIRTIIIDSLFMYMEKLIRYSKVAHKGYEIYNNYNDKLAALITTLQQSGFVVVCICQPELVTIADDQGKNTNARRIYTFGKEHEGKLERYFLIVLFTTIKKGPDGKITYNFLTNTDGISSAKSPPRFFGDKLLVPNDLSVVLEAINKAGTQPAA